LQRLFSTFADGWPGRGLLLQRLFTSAALFHCGIAYLRTAPQVAPVAPQIIGAGAGAFLLVGLWTPLAGALIAIVDLWIVFSYPGDPWIPIGLAVLGASLAVVGPGAWSIDARLFGRKHITLQTFPGVLRVPPETLHATKRSCGKRL
jgi:uncharacterized membrane protein YphA (DoxX/SURF4 family)